jgi:hypothetical protein
LKKSMENRFLKKKSIRVFLSFFSVTNRNTKNQTNKQTISM